MTKSVATFSILLVVAWCVMTVTHECGHLIGGWASGAHLTDFSLVPWKLPYSLHSPDPRPLVTLWSGPVLGVVVPLALATLIRKPTAWLIADFCLLANGVYLALAWFAGDPHLDTPRLMAAGAHPVMIAGYCLVTVGLGYARFRADCVQHFRQPNVTSDSDG